MNLKNLFQKNKKETSNTMDTTNTTDMNHSLEMEMDEVSHHNYSGKEIKNSFENDDFQKNEKDEDFHDELSKTTETTLEMDSLALSSDINYENELNNLYKSHGKDEEVESFSKSQEISENVLENQNHYQEDIQMNDKMEMKTIDAPDPEEENILDKVTEDDFQHENQSDNNILNILKQTNKTSKIDKNSISMSSVSIEESQKKLPLIGSFPIKKQYQIILAALGISVVGLGFGLNSYESNKQIMNQQQSIVNETTSNFASFDSYFNGTIIGKEEDYQKLLTSWGAITTNLQKLNRNQNSEFQNNIDLINKNVNTLKTENDFLKNASQKLKTINQQVGDINTLLDKIIIIYSQTNGTKQELTELYYLKGLLNNINNDYSNIILAPNINPSYIEELSSDKNNFIVGLKQIYYGNPSFNIGSLNANIDTGNYDKIVKTWIDLNNNIDQILNNVKTLSQIKSLGSTNEKIIKQVVLDLQQMKNINNNPLNFYMIILFSILSLIFISLLGYLYNIEKTNKALVDKIENSKNQNAILKLLNELIPLQDGDLTQKTTVTEEITGAIADSINATIDSLGTLVKKIKNSSLLVKEKSDEVNNISLKLLTSNEKQANEINTTGSSVLEITKAIADISTKTKEGSEKAVESSILAKNGAQEVNSSIESMKLINHNINETSLLMKKVGDSSKQISEIVTLLSDITEETNILALNATVQATKAGEAGKGFKIVADSIQELADKAAEANRRVGALISAVQTDIQSAAVSVDKTTEEVKVGVEKSESAGKSLENITKSSELLAEIINNISEEANQYAEIAKQISKNMQIVLSSIEENKDSTRKTAKSIGEILEISSELNSSVQSFKVE
jgi:twitching motility protein PilJ